jgi:hypothetical protein
VGGIFFYIVNLFLFNILIIIVPNFFFSDRTFLVAPVPLSRPNNAIASHVLARRHVRQRF